MKNYNVYLYKIDNLNIQKIQNRTSQTRILCRHSQNSGSAIFGQSHPVLRWVTVRHHGSNEFIINNQYQQKKVFHLAVRGTLTKIGSSLSEQKKDQSSKNPTFDSIYSKDTVLSLFGRYLSKKNFFCSLTDPLKVPLTAVKSFFFLVENGPILLFETTHNTK